MTKERRALTIFWLTVLLLTVGAFAADALLRQQVCTSSMMVDQDSTTINPTVCQ